MSKMSEKFIQEQEARYVQLELEEDKFYDRQVIEEEHGMPNVDEDQQKGTLMTPGIEAPIDPPSYLEQEDTIIHCPGCKEKQIVPAPLSELDIYQCNVCGYMIDLTLDGLEPNV